jgi:penicillin-binding protein 1A
MKIQTNGFDIEINTDDATMSVKIIDASGKELSNNTYSQTMEGEQSEEIVEPDLNTPEETAEEEATPEETVEEQPTEEETTEEPIEEEPTEEEDKTLENENYMPTFEEFMKKTK